MVRTASALIMLASAVGLAAAQSVYQDFEIPTSQLLQFASPVVGLTSTDAGLTAVKAICDTIDNCIGVACNTGDDYCVSFAYDEAGFLNAGSLGYDFVSYRYDAPEGPRCNLFANEFSSSTGQCTCTDFERQNTNFGCVTAIAPSSLPQAPVERRRLAPGHAQRAVFERRRVGGAFL